MIKSIICYFFFFVISVVSIFNEFSSSSPLVNRNLSCLLNLSGAFFCCLIRLPLCFCDSSIISEWFSYCYIPIFCNLLLDLLIINIAFSMTNSFWTISSLILNTNADPQESFFFLFEIRFPCLSIHIPVFFNRNLLLYCDFIWLYNIFFTIVSIFLRIVVSYRPVLGNWLLITFIVHIGHLSSSNKFLITLFFIIIRIKVVLLSLQ